MLMQFFLVQPEKIAVLGISDPYGGDIENVTLINNNTHSYISDNGIIFRSVKNSEVSLFNSSSRLLNDHGCEKHRFSSCATASS